ncbi:hypothetical protein C8J57DRAFT_1512010 [Mycena rebaudengoi]|nr:hypothetical protein C8J57DRAFT_1512010 [Mycena rebaudengoi]
MHPAFGVQNFDRFKFPAPLRRIAIGANKGYPTNLKQMLSKVRDEPHISQSLLFLPALWTNFDPSKIPNPAQLDSLLLLDDTAALDFIIGPTISLETLRLLAVLLPAGLLRELWSRVWQWSFSSTPTGIVSPMHPLGSASSRLS